MGAITTADYRKYLAIGTGVGIEIGAEDLQVVVARVRPSGARVLGTVTIAQFRTRPAAEWGAEYAAFLKNLGGSYLTATVLLPRREVVVRQLNLPGVANRDLAGAVSFQIDSLHPYAENEAAYDYARIPGTPAVLIGMARRTVAEEYAQLFAEAGIKVSSFTFPAAVLYSAIRLFGTPKSGGFLGVLVRDNELEFYGESASRPIFSAACPVSMEKSVALAIAELRLPPETEPVEIDRLLPAPVKAPAEHDPPRETLPYAAALAGACPRPALRVNLLPMEARSSSSRLMYVPAVALASILLLLLVALGLQAPLDDRRYLASLQRETAKLQATAAEAAKLDREIERTRDRSRMLDDVRLRSKENLDALADLTKLLAPPTWAGTLDLTRTTLGLSGESDQAAGLLKVIDGSVHFQNSEFTVSLARTNAGEAFRLRSLRKGVK
jgi:Tfp pilus assembly protein PilN